MEEVGLIEPVVSVSSVSGPYSFNILPESISEQPCEIIPYKRKPNLNELLNKIINEDALIGLKNIPDESVDVVITDPPYGIAKKNSFKDKSHGTFKALDSEWDIFPSKNHYIEFTENWIKECCRILKPTGSIAVWGSRISIFDVQPVLSQFFPKFLDMLTWIKRDSPPNMTRRGMAPSTEFCLIYTKAEKGWTFNHDDIKRYNDGKQMRNYVDIQRTMPAEERTGHPTQKKIETQLLLVEMLSNKNEIVLDPFAGSGTLPVACLKTDRNFIGFELNKEYYAVAKNRIKKLINVNYKHKRNRY